ncbi:2Fe-2S iron-sulfur cluster binding domain-containing protein [Exilibacterium tricleocarpae]|uniref:2Fe-2S iron-sulfur cluster binding domain-containing protein n=1 Tax=Exilibacterium tricleocarpae TaxID=2591008 RepID=A0A545U3F5_9GAMM|nr:2Fe-2S iron-sulfur cluster-binding protein [Exilibacterium tricleocarpae]TQV84009.1 2Fe-2S iron-sulfur cluster binding domain-containing protein [Exilibacterium tricleocarpae]
MPQIIYIEANGAEHEIDVPAGNSVMQGAIDNMIDGILAECGGACACATCHCYVDADWVEKVGPPSDIEKEMLEATPQPQENSRLSCQIQVTDELDGLIVRLPESQY